MEHAIYNHDGTPAMTGAASGWGAMFDRGRDCWTWHAWGIAGSRSGTATSEHTAIARAKAAQDELVR